MNKLLNRVLETLRKFFKRFHKHRWQTRGINRYGGATYRVCLSCRVSQQRVNRICEDEKWEDCDPIKFLDAQFDKNDEYIIPYD